MNYTFSWKDPQIAEIIKKIREVCSCIACELTDEQIWNGGLRQVFAVLSSQLRWSDNGGNTFLNAPRDYVAEVEIDCCFSGIELPHKEVNEVCCVDFHKISACCEETFHLVNPRWSCLQEKLLICKEDLVMSDQDGDGDYESLCSIAEIMNTCSCEKGCEVKWMIDVEYKAGYCYMPDSLLDIVCKLYQYGLLQSNDCGQGCKSLENLNFNSKLTEYSVGDRRWKWEIPDFNFEKALSEFWTTGSMAVLGGYGNKPKSTFVIDEIHAKC